MKQHILKLVQINGGREQVPDTVQISTDVLNDGYASMSTGMPFLVDGRLFVTAETLIKATGVDVDNPGYVPPYVTAFAVAPEMVFEVDLADDVGDYTIGGAYLSLVDTSTDVGYVLKATDGGTDVPVVLEGFKTVGEQTTGLIRIIQ